MRRRRRRRKRERGEGEGGRGEGEERRGEERRGVRTPLNSCFLFHFTIRRIAGWPWPEHSLMELVLVSLLSSSPLPNLFLLLFLLSPR